MDSIYLIIVIILLGLAVMDLVVGVANDAVNFLNSSIGSKVAPLWLILTVASFGVLVGSLFSSGMMEIARSGVFYPEKLTFHAVMILFLAVMITDVVLLDVFNTFGLPTSTTVSLVFELLGAAVAVSLFSIWSNNSGNLGDYINSGKALVIISGIFISIAIAFVVGTAFMYLSRLILSFNYNKPFLFLGAIWGGIALTAITYFAIFKGLKCSVLISKEFLKLLNHNMGQAILYACAGWTLFMALLQFVFRVSILKVVVLAGTAALALAFAGNDLVNFIGVPLAGYSSFIDYTTNGAGYAPDSFLMTSLLGPASTPWYFLVGAGAIMVYALFTSKKAHAVIKTSVDLSRQDEGEETFGSTPIARTLVRISLNMSNSLSRIIPEGTKNWIDSRFRKDEAIIADGGAFDLVRAAVNLVLAGLLIAIGTSLKLPLSTTYVTFMVAMGSSLADRAWGRDSAVFRITGVLSVIGGWFLTTGAAFTICFFVALIIHFGGTVAIVLLIGLAAFTLIRSQVLFKKKNLKGKENETFKEIMRSTDSNQALNLMRVLTREELNKVLLYAEENFDRTVNSFINENLRGLRKAMGASKFEKQLLKQMKRTGTLTMCRLDNNTVLEKGLYYYQGNDFASELVYSIHRLCEPCLEHIDNNFNPLDVTQKNEFSEVSAKITALISSCREKLNNNAYEDFETDLATANALNAQLAHLKREELKRIQTQTGSIKVSMVYLTMIQEAQNVVTYTINLMKVNRKFQMDFEI